MINNKIKKFKIKTIKTSNKINNKVIINKRNPKV